MGRVPAATACVAALGALCACSRPAPGKACRPVDPLACSAPDRALACEAPPGSAAAPAWAEVPCRGPHGCQRGASGAVCDDSLGAEGDACIQTAAAEYACSTDRAAGLECRDGRFTLWRRCRGPGACTVEGGRNIRCDTTVGEPGDRCGQAGTYACSVDHQAMLACDGHALATASSCRGPDGCRVDPVSRKVTCDDSLAQPGDPCDEEGRIACAADRKAELTCTGGVYDKKRECRRTECRLDQDELFCD